MKKAFVLIGLLLGCAAFGRAEQVAKADWCTITTPDSVTPGEAVQVKVEIGTIPEGQVMRVGLVGTDAEGIWVGSNQPPGPKKDVKSGDTITVKVVPIPKEGLAGVKASVWISPDGVWNPKNTKAMSQMVKLTP